MVGVLAVMFGFRLCRHGKFHCQPTKYDELWQNEEVEWKWKEMIENQRLWNSINENEGERNAMKEIEIH